MELIISAPEQSGAPSTLAISGVLDQNSITHDFWKTIAQSQQQVLTQSKVLEVDLKEVIRADTSGLAWLLNMVKDLSNSQVEVRFSNIPDKLQNLAALSGAQTLLRPSSLA